MADNDTPIHAGDALFEAFTEQVKQVLERLYDFAYLQQHSLARFYDGDDDLSAKTSGRQLRQELLTVIESLKPNSGAHFRAPVARLYNILHLYYVENLTIQDAAIELGLSERQAYRDLQRGRENVAAVMWDKRALPFESELSGSGASEVDAGFGFDSEIARLKLDVSTVDLGVLVQQASTAVQRLAHGRGVEIEIRPPPQPFMLSTDSGIAHQVIVSLLSYAVQQALPGTLSVTLTVDQNDGVLMLRFRAQGHIQERTSAISKLAQCIHWKLVPTLDEDGTAHIALHTAPRKAVLFIIDDNQGWIELVGRFLEGYDCAVVSPKDSLDSIAQAQELLPAAIILDVMMPKRDGWEILQRLRAQPVTAPIPVVVCSVFNDPQLAYSLGASAFVAKPANREMIVETLQNLGVI
jgi:CheY-like chemotaxis protein